MAKQELVLDNGTKIEVGAKDITGDEQVLVSEWNPGQAPHFSVPFGLITGLINEGKIESIGNHINGTPVVEAGALIGYIKATVEADCGLEWKQVKAGGGAKVLKENLDAAISVVMSMESCTEAEAKEMIQTAKTKMQTEKALAEEPVEVEKVEEEPREE